MIQMPVDQRHRHCRVLTLQRIDHPRLFLPYAIKTRLRIMLCNGQRRQGHQAAEKMRQWCVPRHFGQLQMKLFR
ncbi:hypothetical protein D3C78_1883070 [compost metagenome]